MCLYLDCLFLTEQIFMSYFKIQTVKCTAFTKIINAICKTRILDWPMPWKKIHRERKKQASKSNKNYPNFFTVMWKMTFCHLILSNGYKVKILFSSFISLISSLYVFSMDWPYNRDEIYL